MLKEYKSRVINNDDVFCVASMESKVVIQEVIKGSLPVCDLLLPEELIILPSEVSLHNAVLSKRYEKLVEEINNPLRKVFIVESNNEIVGKGCLRLKPEEGKAILYSFNILSESRGSMAGLMLLKACFDEISNYQKESMVEINVIRAGRYIMSEVKKPFFENLAKMVNLAIPNTVTVEEDNWKGEAVRYYNFPKEVAIDLLDEIGNKYSSFLL